MPTRDSFDVGAAEVGDSQEEPLDLLSDVEGFPAWPGDAWDHPEAPQDALEAVDSIAESPSPFYNAAPEGEPLDEPEPVAEYEDELSEALYESDVDAADVQRLVAIDEFMNRVEGVTPEQRGEVDELLSEPQQEKDVQPADVDGEQGLDRKQPDPVPRVSRLVGTKLSLVGMYVLVFKNQPLVDVLECQHLEPGWLLRTDPVAAGLRRR